jgi:hypothetical protein
MPVYLVERYVADAAGIAGAVERIAGLLEEAEREGSPLRLLWSARVPADETWFAWYEAPDAVSIADLHRRAACPFDRISIAELLSPVPSASPAKEDVP